MPIAKTSGKLSHDQVIVPRLAHRFDDLLAQPKNRAVGHVRINLEHGCRREHEVCVSGICGQRAIDANQKVQFLQGRAPDGDLRPRGEQMRTVNDEPPDPVRIALEHRRDQPASVRLMAVKRIDGDLLHPDRAIQVGVRLVARAVDREVRVRHRQADSPRDVQVPRKGEKRQHGPNRLHSAIGVLQAGVHHRARPVRTPEAPRQIADGLRRYPGYLRRHFRGEVLNVRLQFLEAVAPVLREVFIVQLFVDQHSNHAEGQGAVRSRPNRNPLGVATLCGLRTPRIDDRHFRPVPGGRFEPVHVQRRGIGRRIRPPDHEQLGVLHVGKHVDEHSAHRDVRGDHRERHVTKGSATHRVR